MKPSGNHQVKHQKQVAFEAKNNPFTKPAERMNLSSNGSFQGRRHGTEYKRSEQPNLLKRFIEYASLKVLNINDDIRKFRHCRFS